MVVYFFVLAFLLGEFLISIYRRIFSFEVCTYREYFFAGGRIRFWPLVWTLIGAHAGSGLVLGVSQGVSEGEIASILYPLGVFLGFIGLRLTFVFRFSPFNVRTLAEIFEKVYGSSFLKRVVSTISLLSLFSILMAQIVGSKLIFQFLGIYSPSVFVGFWTFSLLYTMQGGLRAVIFSDNLQIVFLLMVFLSFGGASFLFSSELPSPSLLIPDGSSFWNFRFLIAPMLFLWLDQDMKQRCFAGSFKDFSKALLFAGFLLLCLGLGGLYFTSIADFSFSQHSQTCVLLEAVRVNFSEKLLGVFSAALLLAITSAASSQVQAIGSICASDFKIACIEKKERIPLVQGISCSIALFAVLFAGIFSSILDLLLFGFSLSICSLFVPLVFALKSKREHPFKGWFSIGFGLLGFFIGYFWMLESFLEILGLSLSLIGYHTGHVVSRMIDKHYTRTSTS